MLKILSDILLAVGAGDLPAVIFLCLSAAINTVDHDVLIWRMTTSDGLFDWCSSILGGTAPERVNRILGIISDVYRVRCSAIGRSQLTFCCTPT